MSNKSQRKEIGDPLEIAATTGKLGRKSQPQSPDAQPSESPAVQTAKSTTKGQRRQQTIYLPPELAKWLKIQAVEEEREISDIVTDALKAYQQTR